MAGETNRNPVAPGTAGFTYDENGFVFTVAPRGGPPVSVAVTDVEARALRDALVRQFGFIDDAAADEASDLAAFRYEQEGD